VNLVLGDFLNRAGRRSAAEDHWRIAADRVQPLARAERLPAMALLARAQLRLGQREDARKLAARVEASNYRHPAYADLVSELAHAAGRG
jgi:hypothetical protein